MMLCLVLYYLDLVLSYLDLVQIIAVRTTSAEIPAIATKPLMLGFSILKFSAEICKDKERKYFHNIFQYKLYNYMKEMHNL